MDNNWFEKHRLIHYTQSEEIVTSILRHGFLLVPNKRGLIHQLLPGDDFSLREPQEFGMISFTELPVEQARGHREQFGDFGICVTWEWALRAGAQRVIYVGESGYVFQTLKWLFELGRQELRREEPGNESPMLMQNKAWAAAHGAQLYAKMLTLYEYMESERNSSQVEWRIVNKIPDYTSAPSRSELIESLLVAAQNWKMGAVPITQSDVEFFVCPGKHVKRLRQSLPMEFQQIPIYSHVSSAQQFASALLRWIWQLQRRRERIIRVPYEPPKGSIFLPKTENGRVISLPSVGRIQGLAFHPDAVIQRASCDLQYTDPAGEWFELKMPVLDALYLLNMLREMEEHDSLKQFNQP